MEPNGTLSAHSDRRPPASMNLIEAQKERETIWVKAGAERFAANLDDPSASPGARKIMKPCLEKLTAALDAHMTSQGQAARPLADPLVPILATLPSDHVAAVVLKSALTMCLDLKATRATEMAVVNRAKGLGGALEHDILFRQWSKDAKGAEKRAVERMKKDMEGTRSGWHKRATQLRELLGQEWDDERRIVVGMSLLAVLVEACPETFEAPVIRSGHKTVRILSFTDQGNAVFTDTNAVASVSSPRAAMMIVPPRPWRYV